MVVAAVDTTAVRVCFICALKFLDSGLAGAIGGAVGVGDGF